MNEVLSTKDRVRLLPTVMGRLASTTVELAAYRLGKRGMETAILPAPKPTPWTSSAADLGQDILSRGFLEHSVRTWRFGMALARADGADLDPELFYVAAMLHDIGLFRPLAGRCFTAAGVAAVRETAPTGTPVRRIEEVEAAIFEHLEIRRPQATLSCYLQAGSLLDVAGTRITALGPQFVRAACEHRAGFPAACRDVWRAECRRFPKGRAAYARCPGGLLIGTRLNPLPH
ncbi:HD domain-containing protein [Kribbella soli]|uniref:HD domain-containing protein n=1 Tax=Kribbella soli TaxID=1124743 RepID=A0A4R0H1F9_9ACTN|nr:HD domain-containing protein [Kribbella soli]TCC04327.1 HD domain-containing protein [Kribbella soli]